ncbi:SRPBCC family protein [Candidatus Nitrospira neomarina]|uniref:SRPBCC family protein n=1 Tax=Candidatus Nitrospira neomarina TaxID=3020899 RepID=A0AA96GNU6_9BACT|nr:SRPBCC family protein [Candidatus Nitrospira neomarina]WNM62613.1 SRPBCC family protein [Candidatus Nitrospira neomarina]
MKNNIGAIEQVLSVGMGTGLIGFGLTQRGKGRILPILVGGSLLMHGFSNHSRLYEALGIDESYGTPIRHPLNRIVHFRKSICINRPAADIYAFWRDLNNLPRFMHNIVAVEILDDTRSVWHARGPFNKEVYWEAEILEERQNEMLTWRTIESESNLEHEGVLSLRRAAGNRGTILSLDCRWSPPGGVFGAAMAKLLPDDPARQVSEDLRRFRQLMETGEITRNQEACQGTDRSGLLNNLRDVSDELGITDPVATTHRPS